MAGMVGATAYGVYRLVDPPGESLWKDLSISHELQWNTVWYFESRSSQRLLVGKPTADAARLNWSGTPGIQVRFATQPLLRLGTEFLFDYAQSDETMVYAIRSSATWCFRANAIGGANRRDRLNKQHNPFESGICVVKRLVCRFQLSILTSKLAFHSCWASGTIAASSNSFKCWRCLRRSYPPTSVRNQLVECGNPISADQLQHGASHQVLSRDRAFRDVGDYFFGFQKNVLVF